MKWMLQHLTGVYPLTVLYPRPEGYSVKLKRLQLQIILMILLREALTRLLWERGIPQYWIFSDKSLPSMGSFTWMGEQVHLNDRQRWINSKPAPTLKLS